MGDAKQHRSWNLGAKTVLVAFSVSALVDFVWSLIARRSIVESVSTAILGLFGIGWYLLLMWGASHDDPDKWVP
jgi:hypothetical protein